MAKQLSELIKKVDPTVVAAARTQADQEILGFAEGTLLTNS